MKKKKKKEKKPCNNSVLKGEKKKTEKKVTSSSESFLCIIWAYVQRILENIFQELANFKIFKLQCYLWRNEMVIAFLLIG